MVTLEPFVRSHKSQGCVQLCQFNAFYGTLPPRTPSSHHSRRTDRGDCCCTLGILIIALDSHSSATFVQQQQQQQFNPRSLDLLQVRGPKVLITPTHAFEGMAWCMDKMQVRFTRSANVIISRLSSYLAIYSASCLNIGEIDNASEGSLERRQTMHSPVIVLSLHSTVDCRLNKQQIAV